MITKRLAYALLLVLNILIVYSNHFGNDFQFDDSNAIPNNLAIRRPETILRAFVDPTLFSSAPQQRTYRPVTAASLALDYWLAGGLNVFFFHLSTFFWYCVQVVLMFLLFERLMDMTDPHPSNFWAALAAAAAFGLHPANAETVNYVIQRGDLYNALGCIAALWLFIRYPAQRKFGWYLLPAALAILAKPPALVFPLLLFAYVLLFENGRLSASRRWKNAIVAALSGTLLAFAGAFLLQRMQPGTWIAGAESPSLYRLTQPFVALHYFKSFFLPTDLNIDAGWRYIDPLTIQALAGYIFVLVLLAIGLVAGRTRCGKPLAFGIVWFFATLLPTSLVPLRDITNDHRMFFCFVGLALAVFWSLRLALFRFTARLTRRPALAQGSVAALAMLLIVAGIGTRVRNRVWLTKQSLWSDSIAKNPRNPRALSNFASIAYQQADYQAALDYWERAAALDPTVVLYQTSIIRAASHLHRNDLAERSYRRILETYPSIAAAYTVYGDWLCDAGRFDEALILLDRARQLDLKSEDVKNARARLIERRDSIHRSALFQALDIDHDNRLSTAELIAAPAVLATLDKNGDGKLTAEEFGTTKELMRSDPLLRALDANNNGEISASEIRNAERELERLERDHNGSLGGPDFVPDYVIAVALRVFARLDLNHVGRIEPTEWAGAVGDPFRGLLTDADTDSDGCVTLEELTNEIFHRADRNKDGIVTREEMDAAMRSGALGPFFRGGGS